MTALTKPTAGSGTATTFSEHRPPFSNAGAETLLSAERIVVKIGSAASLSNPNIWKGIAQDLLVALPPGRNVVLVASGAFARGRAALPPISHYPAAEARIRRALSSFGQIALFETAATGLRTFGILSGQVLVRGSDRECESSAQRTVEIIEDLHFYNILPIINEDDVHRCQLSSFRDNDEVASWISKLWRPDLTVFLTDLPGLYTSDPKLNIDACLLPVFQPSSDLGRIDTTGSVSGHGSGGMSSKMESIVHLSAIGIPAVVSCGLVERPLAAILNGEPCTFCPVTPAAAESAASSEGDGP
ncbi:MAG: hypothetical protein ACFE0R_00840 [Salinarimonas sp.]